LNMQGVVPEELEAVEVVSTKSKEVEPEFVDVVGQISLRSLEKADKKRRDKNRDQRQQQKGGNKPMTPGNLPNPKGGISVQKKPEGQQRGQQPQRPQQGGQQPKPNLQQRNGGPQQGRPQGQKPQGARPQQLQ